jgi:hypothetical protein
MKMQVGIEAGAETVNEGHRAETRRGTRTRAVRPQALLHGAQEQAQSSTLEIGVAVQEVAQARGHRQDPLAQRQVRQDVIGEMRRRRHHAPRVARGANAAPLARERDQEIVPTLPGARSPCPPPVRRVAALGLRVGGTLCMPPLAAATGSCG